jgi:hypothetical protein
MQSTLHRVLFRSFLVVKVKSSQSNLPGCACGQIFCICARTLRASTWTSMRIRSSACPWLDLLISPRRGDGRLALRELHRKTTGIRPLLHAPRDAGLRAPDCPTHFSRRFTNKHARSKPEGASQPRGQLTNSLPGHDLAVTNAPLLLAMLAFRPEGRPNLYRLRGRWEWRTLLAELPQWKYLPQCNPPCRNNQS